MQPGVSFGFLTNNLSLRKNQILNLIKVKFLNLWKKYFGNAELHITFYYSDGDGGA